MGKGKLKRFEEMKDFERVFQPSFEEYFRRDYHLKGRWGQKIFRNDHPVVLELGCGRGEYTIGLAGRFPGKNFIGVDIKGARMWSGSKVAHEGKILNIAFLRTRIEFIDSFFGEDEVSEIWLTFPDPQLKRERKKKRLTGSIFLNIYQRLLCDEGIIHLKTDNNALYNYTLNLLEFNGLEVLYCTDDLYKTGLPDDILNIKTYYERKYLENGSKICYLKFCLSKYKKINEYPE